MLGLDVTEALTRSGWESFEVLDVICVVAALVAVIRAATAVLGDDDNPSIPGSVLTLALGAVALAFILYRVVNPPGIGLNRELGLWVGAFCGRGHRLWKLLGDAGEQNRLEATDTRFRVRATH